MLETVDVDVILNSHGSVSKQSVISVVQNYLEVEKVTPNSTLSNFNKDEHSFYPHVKCIIIGSVYGINNSKPYLDFKSLKINWFVYTLDSYGTVTQTENDEEGAEISLATHLTLPSQELFTLWESLYYDNNIKENLLKYARTMMEFSDKGINPNVISCNRVILLHGPPGTGKTSLCKALGQKLAIKMGDRYSSGLLIEINSHSLFSKWFSESGKLVTRMFTKIKEICENKDILVCVLIDEVESLAHARDQCISGNEPSDSVRVVNAMLTQIDQIKMFPNVLILATSNMTAAIDVAFVDRADIKQYLGLPSVPAIYQIYHSCLVELIKAQVVKCDPHTLDNVGVIMKQNCLAENVHEYSKKLIKVCEKSIGLSGRSLRKIPFLAHALYLNNSLVSIEEFLCAMELAVEKEHSDKANFKVNKH